MGNSKSDYERHKDDDEQQQQRIVIGKEFRLVLGQLNLTKGKIISLSSSSSSDHQHTFASLIQFDIPTSPFDSNEFNTHTLIQYLNQQQSDEKELSHLFKIPFSTNRKTLPTLQIAAIYYDQTLTTKDLNIERISLLNENELEQKIEEFNEKNILSICTSKSIAYIIYTKNIGAHKKYKLIRSTILSRIAFENFQWLHPFIDYSKLGYRLCGLIPFNQSLSDSSFTIYWLFESHETLSYDYCLFEYESKSFSLNNWTSLLNIMSKEEWKLEATIDYNQKKKHGEQIYFLLFFQRLKH